MKRRYSILFNICLLSFLLLTVDLLYAAEVTVSYTYDSLNRLTSATYTSGSDNATVSYQYDELGNITSYNVSVENDSDGDGLSDDLENTMCTDPFDADTDDDGISDGDEYYTYGTDPCLLDTDGDGIQDGTELGYTLEDIGPDTKTNIFQPDLDPTTTTYPLNRDTDGDGYEDGEEDLNSNGRVDPGETDPLDEFNFPGTGDEKIVWNSDRSGNRDIWIMNSDGTDKVQLTTDPASDTGAFISPDGRKIVFGSERTGTSQVWLMDVNGENQTQLTTGGGYGPVWSPDGSKIYYVGPTSYHVSVINSDGTNEQYIGALGVDLQLSPDGTKIAYRPNPGPNPNNYNIFVANVDGSNPVNLSSTAGLTGFERPQGRNAWGNNGKILFTGQEPSWHNSTDYRIWWVAEDGSSSGVILNESDQNNSYPGWSPNETNIVFVSKRVTGDFNVWTMDSEGNFLQQLTSDPGSDASPHWGIVITGGYGDELAIDFGALGLWDVDTTGAWRPISGGDVETMASWVNGLAMDFGSLGLWNFDGTGWTKISGGDAEGLVGWTNGLAMDFGSLGLWNIDTAWTWKKISGGDVETMASWANGMAMDFGGAWGLWNVDITWTWKMISGGDVETMASWANGMAMDFGSSGIWNIDTAWKWKKISGSACQDMSGWANGLAMDFGSSGLWNVDTAGTWTMISGGDCQTMCGWTNGLAMGFGSLGLWNVDTAWTWGKISSGNAETLTDVDLY